MTHHLIDIRSLTKIFESLAGLTGLQFNLLDERGDMILASTKEDAILSHIKRQKKGRELHKEFILENFRFAIKRRDPFIAQGPSQQNHIFIPVQYMELKMLVIAEAFYSSKEDFESYYVEKGVEHALNEKSMEEWLSRISIIPMKNIENMMKNICQLLENVMASCYDNKELNKRLLWFKTMINLIANIKSNATLRDVYEMIVDAVIFLFDVDTVGIFTKMDGYFVPEICNGSNRHIIKELKLPEQNYYVSKACATQCPASVMDSRALWHLGFHEDIISMYIFPIASEVGFFSLLCVFNSLIDNEAQHSLNELCKLTSYICCARHEEEEVKQKSNVMNLVSLKTSELYSHFRESDRLYEMIVNEASNLVDAEKCSLILPEAGKKYLSIAAVKGVNMVLVENMKVWPGEGIAGKAFEQGKPILIDHEDGFKDYAISPRSFFKTNSCLSIPLKIKDEVIGILNFTDKSSGDPFTEPDIFALTPFALQAALLIKLSYFYDRSEKMKELSITDPLTGLFNRRYFDIQMEEEYNRSERYGLNFSLAIVDIDDFKLFNDSEGHVAGDNVLKEISSIMIETLRSHDKLVRFGGEEFAIIMPQTSTAEAYNVAERIRGNIRDRIIPFWKKFPNKNLTVSVGLAMYPECGNNIKNIIKSADKALYRAKIQGKDRSVVWRNISECLPGDNQDSVSGWDTLL